ncbi:hypothetical protein KNT64_gp045 [Pseudomonas phage PspYZU05]|uniref:Uncharacterized protein n=1 Tax=Pseudomonas phage PspYZU05 TaxID=1983556 RepID=A0A2U7NMY9_9CAUD|nr:hypothetical protein KNT64_gp045 [Pseudomonas phage PspYZU05]ASD51997.1 hypothetical protein PspYZU05_45 [Pseudomonas phage PspYZU05]
MPHEAEQTQNAKLLQVAEIRDLYTGILNESTKNSGQLSDLVKVMDLGETKELVIKTMTQISSLSRKEENTATRFLRKFGFGKMIDKSREAVEETLTEGKSVREVSSNLLTAITTKRDRVVSLIDNLYDLRDSMADSYVQMKSVVEGIDEFWQQYSERDHTQLLILKSEIMETMSYHEDNIISANGTIKAAESSMVQISQMVPKLRTQINDSMAIRGILNELEEITEICTTVGDVASELRAENRETMETALISVIERSVISDTQLAVIDKNARRTQEIQNKISAKMVQVEEKRKIAISKLQASSTEAQRHLLDFQKEEK